ncbi:MAG: hypothetical protein HKN12_08385, partial [Gemmatimonadetes bacterium]|nr:hypothetical protein [Gemmatimonadota bacterium]
GYKARYLALQEKWWPAYRTGKRGVSQLEEVVKRDPGFADAYLGLGIYHYYSDVLPGVLQFLGTFVGINGDRERGLREIRRSLLEGVLVPVEARFFLAEIHTSFEMDQWRALEYSRSLRDEFPENELFTWMNARVLDELHLPDLAIAEWNVLRTKPRGGRLRGFLDYRLARSRLFGGDFAEAAAMFEDGFARGFGSGRIRMWAHLRHGECLDFAGEHVRAMEAYRAAGEIDASNTASDRVKKRLTAGKHDASRISLRELEEMARILRATGPHPESDLRRVEDYVTRPSRGLSRRDEERYFAILRDLADARLRAGRPEECLRALDRAGDGWQSPGREARARIHALRARALYRMDRRDAADEAWTLAARRGPAELRDEIRRLREALVGADAASRGAPETGSVTAVWTALDRGELLLELEADFLPAGRRLPFTLTSSGWHLEAAVPAGPVRYRLVTDGHVPRVDPHAERIVLERDAAWCVDIYPKQTYAEPSG